MVLFYCFFLDIFQVIGLCRDTESDNVIVDPPCWISFRVCAGICCSKDHEYYCTVEYLCSPCGKQATSNTNEAIIS